jgi:hypothetical protein
VELCVVHRVGEEGPKTRQRAELGACQVQPAATAAGDRVVQTVVQEAEAPVSSRGREAPRHAGVLVEGTGHAFGSDAAEILEDVQKQASRAEVLAEDVGRHAAEVPVPRVVEDRGEVVQGEGCGLLAVGGGRVGQGVPELRP